MNTDKHWNKFGEDDPYFGVLSDEKYRLNVFTDSAKEEFFSTGYQHVDSIVKKIEVHLNRSFKPNKALDYGCGVGRVLIPLSKYSNEALGVDVSDAMLTECKLNCIKNKITNIRLLNASEYSANFSEKVDFIHSYIVFQHIPVRRGISILLKLLDNLSENGIGVLHFTYSKKNNLNWFIEMIRNNVPIVSNIINAIKRRNLNYPTMQMNSYNINRILVILQKYGIGEFYCDFTDHGKDLGVIIYFEKKSV
ncbi:MAG: class I SAM-dependent methyltransferase [Stygiobacter sp.]|nr:MAG: class I SAM-dependent methyltransferase [Stygiobacter sp.]